MITSMAPNVIGVGDLKIADTARVSPDVQFIFHSPACISIGDYCVIGPGVKFVCSGGDIAIEDWTTLHDRCLVLSGIGVKLCEHGWFGQNSIIDGTGGITVGRGVRVGMYSQLWSHVAAGEQIEGCTLFGERPVTIEDDVWLVGSCIVASGIRIGHRTVALIGSNITKSCEPYSVLAGSPAMPKPNLSFYKPITLSEKWELLDKWLQDIATNSDTFLFEKSTVGISILQMKSDPTDSKIIFAKDTITAINTREQYPDATVCCVENKTYNKCLSQIEHQVLKTLAGNKARFYSLGSGVK